MSCCKTLVRMSLSLIECNHQRSIRPTFSSVSLPPSLSSFSPFSSLSKKQGNLCLHGVQARSFASMEGALPIQSTTDFVDESFSINSALEQADSPQDTVEHLLTNSDDVARLMKMERRPTLYSVGAETVRSNHWFPYLDKFGCGTTSLNSAEVLEAVGPYILDTRKERFKNAVRNRSYSVCLVVEGLNDFGNVSAAFRSADALGFQSVHVVSCDSSKRYRENRHVSMGAEKWLDIELWNSTSECFKTLKSRGYKIATTHLGMDTVSIYDMDWSCPTAIVVGNESKGISDEALELSDLHCSIPMKGMVDSFNVSVAAGILMHHAVCDRNSRLGCHGDLTLEERQILLAEFYLRHNQSAISIAHEQAKRKVNMPIARL